MFRTKKSETSDFSSPLITTKRFQVIPTIMAANRTSHGHPDVRASSTPYRRRKQRRTLSCARCRASKLQCNRQIPCATCARRGLEGSCTYASVQYSPANAGQPAGEVPRPLCSPAVSTETPAHPGLTDHIRQQGDTGVNDEPTLHDCEVLLRRPQSSTHVQTPGSKRKLLPSADISVKRLQQDLPPKDCCDYLVTKFFAHISPLFDVVHGSTFQRQYTQYTQAPANTTLSWLALLFVVCSSAVNTVETDDPAMTAIRGSSPNTTSFSHKLLSSAFTCLSEDQFFFHHDLNTLEALLLAIYVICHSEGVERGWVLLGTALNIAVALRCNINPGQAGLVDSERKRRCWAGILMLHTYQGIIYRDVDMSFLLNNNPTMRAEMNNYSYPNEIAPALPNESQRMSLMQFKIRLFTLSTRICSHIWNSEHSREDRLNHFDNAIAYEQQQWDLTFLVDGAPSVLDTVSYAHWCVLQTYAHQLYLLMHRPFHRSRSQGYRAESREICLRSSMALMNLHKQLSEAPRLQNYRWLVNGMTSFNAFQAAVALASCLLDEAHTTDRERYQVAFDAGVARMELLQASSPVCAKTVPVLKSLQYVLVLRIVWQFSFANLERSHLAEHLETSRTVGSDTDPFEQWIEQVDLLGADSAEWVSNAHIQTMRSKRFPVVELTVEADGA